MREGNSPFDQNLFNNIFNQAFNQPFFNNFNFNQQQQNRQQQQSEQQRTQNNQNNNQGDSFPQNFNEIFNQPFFRQNQTLQQPNQQRFQNQFQQQYQNSQPRNQQNTQQKNNKNIFQSSKKKNQNEKQVEEKLSHFKSNQGQYWKIKGNQLFQKNLYKDALECYSKAIQIDETQSIYYSNRARCFRALKLYQECFKDSQIAIELDDKNIKAYLLCGQSLAQIAKWEKGTSKITNAIQKMMKALSLCTSQKKNQFEKELVVYILRAKKLKWYKKREQELELQQQTLIAIEDSLKQNKNLSAEEIQNHIKFVRENLTTPRLQEKNFSIPDYLMCNITLDIMKDPYITPSGLSYEGEDLKEHIQQNGCIDPITRQPIDKNMIYQNNGIKKAINEYLENNPWAWEYSLNENYYDIEF